MNDDERTEHGTPGDPEDLRRDAVVRAFFDGDRGRIDPLPGDDLRWRRIANEANAPRRIARRAARRAGLLVAAAAAAALIIGGATQLGPRDGETRPAGPTLTADGTSTTTTSAGAASSALRLPRGTSIDTVAPATLGRVAGMAHFPCQDGASTCAGVVRTDIGARAAEGFTELPQSSGSSANGVTFVDERTGWAWGDALWRTDDGGATWTKATFGGGTILAMVSDGRTVTAVADKDGAVGVWSAAATDRALTRRVGTLPAGGWVSLQAVPGGSGALALVGASESSAAGATLHRVDGGAVRALALPPGCAGPHVLVTASSAGVHLLCRQTPGLDSASDYVVHTSTDAGATWRAAATAPAGARLRVRDLPVVEGASDGRTIVVVSGGTSALGGQVLRSTDGGSSWAEAEDIAGGLPDAGFVSVAAVAPDTFVATPTNSVGAIWRSQDGGRTWSRVVMPQA